MKYETLVKEIIENVGGIENINNLTHCITRLRFSLKDNSKTNKESLNSLKEVKGIIELGGQYQIVIGTNVKIVYEDIIRIFPNLSNDDVNENANKNTFLDIVASIFTPIISLLAASGFLKGIFVLGVLYDWVPGDKNTYIMLNSMADGLFYFLPFFVAITASKKFKVDIYMAVLIAAILMYPLQFNEGEVIKLFTFIPIPIINYSQSVIPILLSVIILKYVSNFYDKIIPGLIRFLVAPALTLLTVGIISLSLLAPLGSYIGVFMAEVVRWLMEFSPGLTGFVYSATQPILVLVGMHHALNPISQEQLANFGISTLSAMTLMSVFAQATAPIVVYFKSKNTKEKDVAISAVLPGFLGITEPSLYGVLTQYKGAMIAAIIGGGIGGAVCSILGGRSVAFVLPGILSMPAYMGQGFIGIVIGAIVSITLTAFLTLILVRNTKNK